MGEPATSSRADDAVEAGWNVNFGTLLDNRDSYRSSGNAHAAEEYRRAVDHVVNEVLAAHSRFAADGDELSPDHATDADRAREAYSDLLNMLDTAQQIERPRAG